MQYDTILKGADGVSVCIPAYNEERTIASTIESVLKQVGGEASDMEILIGANACTDGTADEVSVMREKYGDTIRLFEIEEKGKPNAWNVLAENARSELLIFIDGDVRIEAGAFSKLAKMLLSRDDLVIAQGTNAAIMRDLSFLMKLSRRRPNAPNGILIKEWQDTICGRMYAAKRLRLRSIMSEFGHERMPAALIHEDGWLRRLLDLAASRHRGIPLEEVIRGKGRYWEVCRDALVYYVPPDKSEEVKIRVRTLHAREQLSALFPEYDQAVQRLRSRSASSNRTLTDYLHAIRRIGWSQVPKVGIQMLLSKLAAKRARRLFLADKAAGRYMSSKTFSRSESSKKSMGAVNS